MMSIINRLSQWYSVQCIHDWHEDKGVKIDTLDNPGWSIQIDLEGTNLSGRNFEDFKSDRSDQDWVFAYKRDGKFEAYGGVFNLEEMFNIFLNWAEQN